MKDTEATQKKQVEEHKHSEGKQLLASGATGVSPQMLEIQREQVLIDVFKELNRAEGKFPGFPTDPIHAAAIVTEESGELQQAALQWAYEGGTKESTYEEAIQTAAMALRFLFHIEYMQPTECEQVEL